MNTKTYNAIMNIADKAEAWATKVEHLRPVVDNTLEELSSALIEFADTVRRDATKQRMTEVWGETTDSPRAGGTNAGGTQPSSKTAENLAAMAERLKREYLKTSSGANDPNPTDTITDLINDLFNRGKGGKA